MKFSFKLSAFVAAITLAGSVFATQDMECPDIEDIKAEGIFAATEFLPGLYGAGQISEYNMDSPWIFVLAPLMLETEDEALEEANNILGSMSIQAVPKMTAEGFIACWYPTGRPDVLGVAVGAEIDTDILSTLKLRKILKASYKK